jgi:hypothetical protein
MPPEWTGKLAENVYLEIGSAWPLEDGDEPALQAHLDSLDELILDPSTPDLARQVARLRREDYAQWAWALSQQQQGMAQAQQAAAGAAMGGAQQQQPQSMDPAQITYQQAGGDAGQWPAASAA